MLKFFYNLFLLGGVVATLPYFLWQMLVRKKYCLSIKNKWGIGLPKLEHPKGRVIWVHSVSVGETLAVIPLLKLFTKEHPEVSIVFSTTTETGQEIAKKNLPFVDTFFYLPFDFSWNIKKVLKRYRPSLLVLVESDFWYNMLTLAKEKGVDTLVVNGKISERSCRRFLKIPFFSRPLFNAVDHVCAQSIDYKERFRLLMEESKISATGNLKLDFGSQEFVLSDRVKHLLEPCLREDLIVIGSSHEGEEELLLKSLRSLLEKSVRIILVPRHVERCPQIENLLKKLSISYDLFSKTQQFTAKLLLVDEIGLLKSFYYYSKVSIVCGTFVSHIGGHNLFEPLFLGKPVIYGPHTFTQKEMDDLIQSSGCGVKVNKEERLLEEVEKFLYDSEYYESLSAKGIELTKSLKGSVGRTLDQLEKLLKKG